MLLNLSGRIAGPVAVAAAILSLPAAGHHSFAMYDRDQSIVFTGVVTRIDPDTNHLMIQFAPMNAERNGVVRDDNGEPVIWALEMQAASAVARFGITPTGFPPGTVFSAAIYPDRSGAHSGTQVMGEHSERVLYKCPNRTPPAPGKHCDSVEGATAHGTAAGLPAPTGTIEGR